VTAIRPATARDVPALLELMRGLAAYEKLPPPGAAAAARLRAALRGSEPRLCALLAWDGAIPVGYALYLFTFSSFLVRPTLYLEDLFVVPEVRGRGFGRRLFETCRRTARRRGCARMEWVVLDWNKPAHRFYRKAGARRLADWVTYRLTLRRDAF